MRLTGVAILLLPAMLSAAEPQRWCEASIDVRHALNGLEMPDLKGQEREQAQKERFQALLGKYPDDVFVNLRYQRIFRGHTQADRHAVIDHYQKLAELHPGEALYQFLYAEALLDTDTPRSIQLAETIISTHPDFARAHLLLAAVYSWGKFIDRQKTRLHLDSFFEACPATLDSQALALAQRYGGAELAAKLIPGLRTRLSTETDPDQLEKWETVWNLEFKARPVSEHDQLRKQIAADLERLQNAKGTGPSWLMFLKNGYHLAGNEPAAKEQEAKLLAEYPNSQEAQRISNEPWEKAHRLPGLDKTKQTEYWRAALARAEEGLKKSPDSERLLMLRFNAVSNLEETPVDQLTAAGDALIAAAHKDHEIFATPPFEIQVARAYLKRHIRVDEVPRLVEEGWASHREMNAITSDRDPDDIRKMQAKGEVFLTREAALILLDAAQQLHKPEIARAAVEKVEALKPEEPFEKSSQFEVQAKWAELEGRKLDALLLYRAAIDARPAGFKPSQHDELSENMERLSKELGGTEISRRLLANKVVPAVAANEGVWEKPAKDMKPWQLSDLNGKTWKLASLEGKTILINVWASWCGPCKAEHPHLQKLYDRVKADPKIEILTFNVDDEIGNVAPYVKENKYTFPVLLAKGYADDLSVDSIPRNWIVNSKGKWEWQQIGFGPDDKWEDEILAKVKETK